MSECNAEFSSRVYVGLLTVSAVSVDFSFKKKEWMTFSLG